MVNIQVQTISHIVNECHNTILPHGGLQKLHPTNRDTVDQLEQTVMKAPVK